MPTTHGTISVYKVPAGLFHTMVSIKMSLLLVITESPAKIEVEVFKFPIRIVHKLNSGNSETSKKNSSLLKSCGLKSRLIRDVNLLLCDIIKRLCCHYIFTIWPWN